jgi:hypothetical protein
MGRNIQKNPREVKMRQLLNRLELYEANFENDLAVRSKAKSLYNGLIGYLTSQKKPLSFKGTLSLDASEFWKDDYFDLTIVFKGLILGGNVAAMGTDTTNRKNKTLYLHLLAPKEIKKGKIVGSELADRLEIGPITHELAHAFDPGAQYVSYGTDKLAKGFKEKYYNTPTEWNSFWQEGVANLESAIDSGEQLKYRTLGDLTKDAKRFWSESFIRHMDVDTKRKFDKRIYALYIQYADKLKGDT